MMKHSASLIKYHGGGDPDDKLVALEYREFQEGIQLDGIDKRWWDCQSRSAIPS